MRVTRPIVRVYVAAPLFNEMEKQRNLAVAKELEEAGFSVFLPQRDAGEIVEDDNLSYEKCYKLDKEAIDKCHWLVALCDGRIQDEGMCWEIGYAYALKKKICLVYDDVRRFTERQFMNNMLMSSAHLICQYLDEAIGCIKTYKRMPD